MKLMMDINKKDTNAAKRFGEHIKVQGRRTVGFQHLLTTQEGKRVEGEEAWAYIRQTKRVSSSLSRVEQWRALTALV